MIDFHAHFNNGEPEKVRAFVANCEKNNCFSVVSGGLRYGSHDYVPNDTVIDYCNEYKDWLIPMVKIDLWDSPVDIGELHRLVDRGARAVKCIYPYHPYDHDLYMPLYEECEKLGLPMLFHTGNFRASEMDTVWRRPVVKNMDPMNLDRPARSFQKLNIVLAHMGTVYWRHEASLLARFHKNIYCDLAGNGSWQGMSAEELAERMAPQIGVFRDQECFRKLVFGSDCYIDHQDTQDSGKLYYEQKIAKLGLSAEIRNAIMGDTVAGWLGIKNC